MFRSTWCAVALAMAVIPAQAQESETSKTREELKQLQQRMQALEKKLQETEATAAQAASQASSRPASVPHRRRPACDSTVDSGKLGMSA